MTIETTDPVFAEKTITERVQSITAAPGGAGVQITHTAATSLVVLRNIGSAKWDIEYRVGSGEWLALGPLKSVSLTINLATTALRVRRGENSPLSTDVLLTLEGVPGSLLVGDPGIAPPEPVPPVPGDGLFPAIAAFDGLLAFWDFSEARAPFYSKAGKAGPMALRQGPGSRVVKGSGGPLGHSVVFNGTSDYLVISADEIGLLNIGARTNQCFVLAFVRRETQNTDFIAGIWQEDNNDPRRQYGLFIDLPLYGGPHRVCMHVSKTGGASPGLPYSRDYSANGKEEIGVGWTCIAGSYDGAEARSYVEGRFETFPTYTEPGPPDGQSLTYAKNPYAFGLGLNETPADFTVGAVKLTAGMSNFFGGEIAALLVMDRCPSAAEVQGIQSAINGAGWGFKSRMRHINGPQQTGIRDVFGAASYLGSSASIVTELNQGWFFAQGGTQTYLVRAPGLGTGPALAAIESVPALVTTENLRDVTFSLACANAADTVRLAVKIGAQWFATDATFSVTALSPAGSDWANAETKTVVFSRAGSGWRDVTLTPGATLAIAGSARTQALPSGEIAGFGVWSGAEPAGGVRVRDFEFQTL
jgi:hypothetical protein